MRVLICGSRTFEDDRIVRAVLDGMWDDSMTVIEGGARGADKIAATWTKGHSWMVKHEQFPADWNQYGKSAGIIRNGQMLDEGKPDVVVAFVDKPLAESRGTHHMVRIARNAGVPTYVVEKVA